MKLLSEMSKKELENLTKEQQKQIAIKEIKEILSKDTFFDNVNVDITFYNNKHSHLKVFNKRT